MNNQIFLNGISLQELAEALAPLLLTQHVLEPEPINDFITRDVVCEILSINLSSLWKHTKNGKLQSYGIGNRVLYKRAEVLEAVKPINH
jgi:hypothetical protein